MIFGEAIRLIARFLSMCYSYLVNVRLENGQFFYKN